MKPPILIFIIILIFFAPAKSIASCDFFTIPQKINGEYLSQRLDRHFSLNVKNAISDMESDSRVFTSYNNDSSVSKSLKHEQYRRVIDAGKNVADLKAELKAHESLVKRLKTLSGLVAMAENNCVCDELEDGGVSQSANASQEHQEKPPFPSATPSTDGNSDRKATEQTYSQSSYQCTFDGKWGSYLGDIKLHQTGTTVQGKADYDSDVIEGNVKGNVMYGHWHKPDHSIHGTDGGDLILTLSEDCSSYSGKWRHGTEKNGDDFYGWHSWDAKRKAGSKMAKTIKQPVVKKNQKEMLQDKLKNLQRQWDASLKQIAEQRAKGEDVTDLKQNLMRIRVQQQQARKHLEKLNDK